MSDRDTNDALERKRTEEAVSIIRRLDENPHDRDALADREAFLSRGVAERQTFQRTLAALGLTQTKFKNDRRNLSVLLALILAGSLLFAWQPLKLMMFADFQTEDDAMEVVLASGDAVILDASSALSDNTGAQDRHVTLLAGAGYFDVETTTQSFVVEAGSLTIRTLGTAFEVSRDGDDVLVAVGNGSVELNADELRIVLNAGERVRWRDDAMGVVEVVPEQAVASWRTNELFADGMTVVEVAETIDRRLDGPVIVLSEDLANQEVTGRLDLSRPREALETLSASVGARVTVASPIGALIRP